jgi:hypothetical protein
MRILAMRHDWRIRGGTFALFAAGVAALLPAVSQAQPVSAELAKKCKILRAKQFPPRQTGNPAAGSAYGSGQDKREFFRRCVENGGNIAVVPPLR